MMTNYMYVMAAWLFGLLFGFMATTSNGVIAGVIILLITALLLAGVWTDLNDYDDWC